MTGANLLYGQMPFLILLKELYLFHPPTCKKYFFYLPALRHIRSFLTEEMAESIVSAMVLAAANNDAVDAQRVLFTDTFYPAAVNVLYNEHKSRTDKSKYKTSFKILIF